MAHPHCLFLHLPFNPQDQNHFAKWMNEQEERRNDEIVSGLEHLWRKKTPTKFKKYLLGTYRVPGVRGIQKWTRLDWFPGPHCTPNHKHPREIQGCLHYTGETPRTFKPRARWSGSHPIRILAFQRRASDSSKDIVLNHSLATHHPGSSVLSRPLGDALPAPLVSHVLSISYSLELPSSPPQWDRNRGSRGAFGKGGFHDKERQMDLTPTAPPLRLPKHGCECSLESHLAPGSRARRCRYRRPWVVRAAEPRPATSPFHGLSQRTQGVLCCWPDIQ